MPVQISMLTCGVLVESVDDRLDVEAETILGLEIDIWGAVLIEVWGDGRVELSMFTCGILV